MIVPVTTVSQPGLVQDVPAHRMALSGWSDVRNVRFALNGVRTVEGYKDTFILESTIMALFPIREQIVAMTLTGAFRLDGDILTSIGRPSPYTGSDIDYWMGGVFNNWLVVTNGVDVPQVLDTNSLGIFSDMPAWPGARRAKVIRPFREFLIALGVSDSGTYDMRRVKWSTPADPGTLPASWDHTDPAVEAGELSLGEGSDIIVDGVQMQDEFFIFTAQQTWAMRYIGGQFIFSVAKVSDNTGLLAPGCFTDVPGAGLLIVTPSDIIVLGKGSIAEGTVRNEFFKRVDAQYYHRTRVLHLLDDNEVWIVFPESGSSLLTLAYVWNYRLGVWSLIDIPTSRCAAARRGSLEVAVETIDSDSLTCDGESEILCDTGPGVIKYSRLVYFGYDGGAKEITPTENLSARLERTGIAYVGPEAIDEYSYKRALALRLDVTGGEGSVVMVTPGYQTSWSTSPVWDTPIPYVIGQKEEVQFSVVGRFICVRFEWTDPSIAINGYVLEVVPLEQRL